MNFSNDLSKSELPHPGQTRMLLNQLEECFENLETSVSELHEVLSPVLSREHEPRTKPNDIQSDGGGMSHLAAELSQRVDTARVLRDRIRDLRDRVDL